MRLPCIVGAVGVSSSKHRRGCRVSGIVFAFRYKPKRLELVLRADEKKQFGAVGVSSSKHRRVCRVSGIIFVFRYKPKRLELVIRADGKKIIRSGRCV